MSSSIYSNDDDIDEEYIGSSLEDLEAIEPGADNSALYNKTSKEIDNQNTPINKSFKEEANIKITNNTEKTDHKNINAKASDQIIETEEDDEEDEEVTSSVDSEEVQIIKDKFTKFCFQHSTANNPNLLSREEYEKCKLALLHYHLHCQERKPLNEKWKKYALGNDQREIFHYSPVAVKLEEDERSILLGDKGNLFLWLEERKSSGVFKRLIPLDDFFDALCFLQDAEEGPFSVNQLFLIAKDIFYGITEELVKRFYVLMSTIKKWSNDDTVTVEGEENNDDGAKSGAPLPLPLMKITHNLPKIEPKPNNYGGDKEHNNNSYHVIEGAVKVLENNNHLKRPASREASRVIHSIERINKAKDLVNEIIELHKDEEDLSAQCDKNDQFSAHNLFIRRIVDICLDRTVSLSQQPSEVINVLESICRHCFGQLDPQRHRTKIGNYLKSCRKSRQKYLGKVFVRETPSHTYTGRAQSLMEAAFERFRGVLEVLECGDNEANPIVTYAVSNCTSVKQPPALFASSASISSAVPTLSIRPRPSPFLRPSPAPHDTRTALKDKFRLLLNKMDAAGARLDAPGPPPPPLNVRKDLDTIQSAIHILRNYESHICNALATPEGHLKPPHSLPKQPPPRLPPTLNNDSKNTNTTAERLRDTVRSLLIQANNNNNNNEKNNNNTFSSLTTPQHQ